MSATMIDQDAELEAEIENAFQKMLAAHADEDVARNWFHVMVALVRRRSPEQIERMERARGLRAK
jgi:hypothetical protein